MAPKVQAMNEFGPVTPYWPFDTAGGIIGIIAFLFVAYWVLLWIFLPFAIFGFQPLLKDLAKRSAESDNQLLAEIRGMRRDLQRINDTIAAAGSQLDSPGVTAPGDVVPHADDRI